MRKKELEQQDDSAGNLAKHVGGVSDDLGGVDPVIDETLLRLSGGP